MKFNILFEKSLIVTAAIICNNKHEILLGQKDPEISKQKDKWLLPGGHYENQDKNIQNTLKREIQEETNLSLDNSKILQIHQNTQIKFKTCLVDRNMFVIIKLITNYIFLVELADKQNLSGIKPGDDLQKLQWFDLSDIPENITKLVAIVLPIIKNQLSENKIPLKSLDCKMH